MERCTVGKEISGEVVSQYRPLFMVLRRVGSAAAGGPRQIAARLSPGCKDAKTLAGQKQRPGNSPLIVAAREAADRAMKEGPFSVTH